MKLKPEDTASLTSEQLRSGFRSLLFAGQLEEEFRHYYSRSSVSRARLMPSFTIMMTLILVFLHLSSDKVSYASIAYDIFVLMPLLIGTLYTSTKPSQFRSYQVLLALSALLSGFLIVSVVFRPILPDMPSYFPIETTWVFAIWLIHGLRFRVAALIAMSVSAMHMFGVLFSGYGIKHAGYDIVMLLMVNGIGAIACYQLEYAIRRAFLESKEVKSLATELGKLAQLDGLTGLNNRRCYDEQIERIWNQSRREQVPLSILLIDIDHFKAYNDQYGHQQGDDALKSVARVISACERRPLDIAARFGGEEFILVLYGQDERAGAMIGESLREAISMLQIPHSESPTHPSLTASIGVAVIMPDAQRSCAGAVQMADEALYQAKAEGRNRVVIRESNVSTLNTGSFRSDHAATA